VLQRPLSRCCALAVGAESHLIQCCQHLLHVCQLQYKTVGSLVISVSRCLPGMLAWCYITPAVGVAQLQTTESAVCASKSTQSQVSCRTDSISPMEQHCIWCCHMTGQGYCQGLILWDASRVLVTTIVLPGRDRPHVGSPLQSHLSCMSAWRCLWCCFSSCLSCAVPVK